MHVFQRAVVALIAGVTLSTGCKIGDDIVCDSSCIEDVAGTYHATRIRFTQTGQATVDALAAGATISIVLNRSGITTGTLFIPASLNGGVAETLDLTGTFLYSGTQVTFDHAADTFIRDVTWTFNQSTSQLSTTATAGGVQYDVILGQ